MKRLFSLILFQCLTSVISGILISKMSFIGRIAVSTTRREYLVFKTWWKTALIILAIQLFLILILWIFKRISNLLGVLMSLAFLLLIGFGVYYTYLDFTQTSHKYMRIVFHSGFYLAWASGAFTCFYFIFTPFRKKIKAVEDSNVIL